jgi:DNA-binding GntR family transcriptional regulator
MKTQAPGEPAQTAAGAAALRLPRVRPQNLSEEVYTIVRSRIIGQGIAPGTRLLEAELAEQLGVSRAPIREALRKLEHEGLIESFPRRGAIVVRVPDDEIEMFYGLRAEIEANAFARACTRITDEDLENLEAIVEELEGAYAAADVDAVLDADLKFHGAVMEISGLTLLRRVWSSFDGPLRLRAYQLIEADPDPETALVESADYPHTRLLAALRARDAEDAANAVRHHILEVSSLYHATSRPAE